MVDQIIFVSPPNLQLGYFHSFLPRAVPFGAGLLAARMRALGEQVQLWDLEVHHYSDEEIMRVAPGGGANVVFGISCMTPNAAQGYAFARRIRKIAPAARIVFGGIHPSAVPEEPLSEGCADVVVRGEGEEVFPELLRRWRDHKEVTEQPGVSCRDANGQIVHGPPAPPILDLDAYPPFPYDLIDVSKYHLGLIQTSRGCPYNCIFCSQRVITGRRYRYHKTEHVINELEFLVSQCHQRSIMFVDDFFTADQQRVTELCGEIRRRRLNEKACFGAQTRADRLSREILREMRSAGFENLAFGFETASEAIMTLIEKKETVAEVVKGARLASQEGFNVEGVFIFGFPGETLEDRLRCFRLAREVGLGRARFNNVIPYPGCRLYDMAKKEGRLTILKNWSNFNSAGAVSSRLGSGYVLPYVPNGTTDGALQGDVLLATMLFYFNSRKLGKMVTSKREPSGIGFELTFRQLLEPVKIACFILAVATMILRTTWFLVGQKECRRFLRAILMNRLPDFDSGIHEALSQNLEKNSDIAGQGRNTLL